MPRLLGVDIPGRKRIEYALSYIYGIGPARAKLIVHEAGIDPAKRADDLTPDELRSVLGIIQTRYRVEGDLRREVAQNIRRLISIGSYRGLRHRERSKDQHQRPDAKGATEDRGRRSRQGIAFRREGAGG